ncbi:MAG: hypothetical protein K2X38_24120 [Gemmataceae bacterium]|nr:hypothetical protein [Gemmataceae bacterium]
MRSLRRREPLWPVVLFIILAAVLAVGVFASRARADEPPRPTLRIFCFAECYFCKLFEEDCKAEPLRSALARFEVVKCGKAEAPQYGVKAFPTFRIDGGPVVRVYEGYPGDGRRRESRAEWLAAWLKLK